jgi:hypothetical protein
MPGYAPPIPRSQGFLLLITGFLSLRGAMREPLRRSSPVDKATAAKPYGIVGAAK